MCKHHHVPAMYTFLYWHVKVQSEMSGIITWSLTTDVITNKLDNTSIGMF